MTLLESLTVSVIGFAVVFMVLILLSLLIKIQSMVLKYFIAGKNRVNETTDQDKEEMDDRSEVTGDEDWSAGELKLVGVDEKTAAMIMAIVSHESKIPLSELQFKMIRAID